MTQNVVSGLSCQSIVFCNRLSGIPDCRVEERYRVQGPNNVIDIAQFAPEEAIAVPNTLVGPGKGRRYPTI